MITFQKCFEIFSDSEKFQKIKAREDKLSYYRVTMENLSKDGYHYEFGFRKRPNGYNDVAQVFLSKWTPMRAFVVFGEICSEKSLLNLIDVCHNSGAI